ncbi:MAG: hypothetical protein MUD14_16150 [Hydrococcus sp. Prado102]|jgi:hypothetical protein|nr:hypothetical protein [Hydrococcus sp. Prado102]
MSDTDNYILDAIKIWVWSGFYDPDEVNDMIDDILEDDANEEMLRSAIALEFDKKAAAEALWSIATDCDRLDLAFEELNASGIIALQNTGFTMSDGHAEVAEELDRRDRANVKGYCFYHGQDLERAVKGDGLWLAFGDLDDAPATNLQIGNVLKNTLEKNGFTVEWNGDSQTRISIPKLHWKRRRSVRIRDRD